MTARWMSGRGSLGEAATKAGVMYLAALLGLRLAHHRTLAQWTAIDFAAVSVGAIVGRTAVASGGRGRSVTQPPVRDPQPSAGTIEEGPR